jgi:hypothetical protein
MRTSIDQRTQSLCQELNGDMQRMKTLVKATRRGLKTQLAELETQCGVEAAVTHPPVCTRIWLELHYGRRGPSKAGLSDPSSGSVRALAILEETADGDTSRNTSQKRSTKIR